MDSAIWLIAIVVFAVIEASTAQLLCIWFALGAVLSLVASIFTDNLIIQVVVFIFSSIVLLALTKKMVARLIDSKKVKTNADSLIGKTFVLSEEVDNDKEIGSLKASGTYWSVRSLDGGIIPSGEKVTVEKIEGVKLFVKKAE